MPRRPRIEVPGGIHHVWQRGNNKRVIFVDDEDRHCFLRLLARSVRKYGLRCLSYCLMSNHFHLVVETPMPTLGAGMRDLGSSYAQLFNERHETGGGHVFQARYNARIVETDEHFAQLLRYVAMNPVQAGLCDDPSAWPWSSHSAHLEPSGHPLVATERVADLLEGLTDRHGIGYADLFESTGPLAHLDPDTSPWDIRPSLPEIFGSDDRGRALVEARDHGYRLIDLAEYLGVTPATVCRWLKRHREELPA